MQRLGSPWLLNRQVTARQYVLTINRHASIKAAWPRGKIRRTAPSFDVGSLLLDLDAENAKHVRQYNPDIDGVPERRLAKRDREDNAVEARISDFTKALHQGQRRFEMIVENGTYKLHINDLDVFATALSGSTQKHQTVTTNPQSAGVSLEEEQLQKTLQYISSNVVPWNGIPQSASRDSDTLVQYMSHQQKKAKSLATPESTNNALASILKHFNLRQNDFFELKREIQFLLGTPNGPRLVSDFSDKLGRAFYTSAPEALQLTLNANSPQELLVFCNDIVFNLVARNLPVAKSLWSAGLHLAIRCSAYSAARLHIAAGLGPGHREQGQGQGDRVYDPLKMLLEHLEERPRDDLSSAPALSSLQRPAAIFNLMTGFSFGRDYSQISFRNMLKNATASDHTAFAVYIQILGELGALRTIWYIYQRLSELFPAMHTHRDTTRRSVGPDASTEPDPFVEAISRILWNVKGGRFVFRSSEKQEAVDSFAQVAQLDFDTVRQSTQFIAKDKDDEDCRPEFIRRCSTLQKDIQKALGECGVKDAIPAIQKLLERI